MLKKIDPGNFRTLFMGRERKRWGGGGDREIINRRPETF